MRSFFLSLLASGVGGAGVASGALAQDARYGVIYSESRPINFTGSEAGDTLTIQHVGETCLSSVVVYTVRRRGDGFPVFVKSAPIGVGDPASAPELRAFYERCDPKAGVSEDFWAAQREAVVDDRLTFVPVEAREGLIMHVDASDLGEALGAQLLCLPEGYETTNCYWFDARQGGARLFLSYGF